jgi:hypothetical protein
MLENDADDDDLLAQISEVEAGWRIDRGLEALGRLLPRRPHIPLDPAAMSDLMQDDFRERALRRRSKGKRV